MKLQKYIKEIFITLFIISITTAWYAAVATVADWDNLTATLWNDMKNSVDENTAKLVWITNGTSLDYKKTFWSTISIDSDSSWTELSFRSNWATWNDGSIVYNATKDMHFYTDRSSSTDSDMTIKADWKIWIWNVNPSVKLDINGNVKANYFDLWIEKIQETCNTSDLSEWCTATCSVWKNIISGWCITWEVNIYIRQNYPASNTTWVCKANDATTIYTTAICWNVVGW